MVLYKVLDANGCSCNGGSLKWSLPTKNDDGTWTPGEWMPEIEGPLVECKNGYHLATMERLPQWLNERIFMAEVDGELVESTDHDKWVARKVRLVSETAWDKRTARLFAADCAGHVLHLYEREYQDDSRPRMAIETARKYTNGKATREELAAARAAAWAAARADAWAAARAAADAAWDAAWDAAADAWAAARAAAADARDAAGDAAGADAWAAAWAAARAAAADARDAAGDAAGADAWAAARDAAGADARAAADAAWDAELEWQSDRLAEYLEVR